MLAETRDASAYVRSHSMASTTGMTKFFALADKGKHRHKNSNSGIAEPYNVRSKLCRRPTQYAPAPCKLTFDLESGVRIMCDVGYLCANFSLPRPLCS